MLIPLLVGLKKEDYMVSIEKYFKRNIDAICCTSKINSSLSSCK